MSVGGANIVLHGLNDLFWQCSLCVVASILLRLAIFASVTLIASSVVVRRYKRQCIPGASIVVFETDFNRPETVDESARYGPQDWGLRCGRENASCQRGMPSNTSNHCINFVLDVAV